MEIVPFEQIVDKSIINSQVSEEIKKEITQFVSSFANEIDKYNKLISDLVITSEFDKQKMQQAREGRLYLKNKRCRFKDDIDERREKIKNLMAEYTNHDDLLRGLLKLVETKYKELESELEKKEKYAETIEQQRKDKLQQERTEKLLPFKVNPQLYDLRNMDEQQFQIILQGVIAFHEQEARKEAEEKEKREQEEKEKQLNHKRIQESSQYANYISGYGAINFGKLSDQEYTTILQSAKEKKEQKDIEIKLKKQLHESRLQLALPYHKYTTLDLADLSKYTADEFDELNNNARLLFIKVQAEETLFNERLTILKANKIENIPDRSDLINVDYDFDTYVSEQKSLIEQKKKETEERENEEKQNQLNDKQKVQDFSDKLTEFLKKNYPEIKSRKLRTSIEMFNINISKAMDELQKVIDTTK